MDMFTLWAVMLYGFILLVALISIWRGVVYILDLAELWFGKAADWMGRRFRGV